MTKKYLFEFRVSRKFQVSIEADSAVAASNAAAKVIQQHRAKVAEATEVECEVSPLTLKSIISLPKCSRCSKDIQSGDLRVIMLDENVEQIACSDCEREFENETGQDYVG